jgi:hypothetical protein
MYQVITNNIDDINMEEIKTSMSSNDNFGIIVNEIILLFSDVRIEFKKYEIINYLNNHNITPQE